MTAGDPQRIRAAQMLLLATTLWGLSFPVMKALTASQQASGDGGNSWFLAAWCVVVRFGLAGAGMFALAVAMGTLRGFTALEAGQGIGLGLFGGAGILLQVDGLSYTSASTSAFLTQAYCVWLPLWAALRLRRSPGTRVIVSCGLVVAGVAVLAGVDWRNLVALVKSVLSEKNGWRTLLLGRGEWETLLASVLFTGQILWLERPRYAANNVTHFSLVMFGVIALLCLPVALATAPSAAAWMRAYDSAAEWGLMAILIVPCTFGSYLLMNHWQRHIPATYAGLIYALEPVFASGYALFLPAWFSQWTGVAYANEQLTGTLLLGGALITAANVLLYLPIRWPVARPAPCA